MLLNSQHTLDRQGQSIKKELQKRRDKLNDTTQIDNYYNILGLINYSNFNYLKAFKNFQKSQNWKMAEKCLFEHVSPAKLCDNFSLTNRSLGMLKSLYENLNKMIEFEPRLLVVDRVFQLKEKIDNSGVSIDEVRAYAMESIQLIGRQNIDSKNEEDDIIEEGDVRFMALQLLTEFLKMLIFESKKDLSGNTEPILNVSFFVLIFRIE